MSFVAAALNPYLRWTEKSHMRKAADPDALRRSFLFKSRLFFHAPFGTRITKTPLGPGDGLAVTPRAQTSDTVLLYFHGGGYIFGAPETHAAMLGALCRASGMRALLPRYPLAPEHPYPAAPDFAEAAYFALCQDVEPARIFLGGDSAGGGLALALLARLIAKGHPMPAGLFAFSPLTDLTFSGDSVQTNAPHDVVLPAERTQDMATHYLNGADPTHPDASPLWGRFQGGPPVWLTVGDTEILRDDTRRLAARLRDQSVDVRMTEEHDLPHVWPIFHNTLPEARRTLGNLGRWLNHQAG